MHFPTTCNVCRKQVTRRMMKIDPTTLRGYCLQHAPSGAVAAKWEDLEEALYRYHNEEFVDTIMRYSGKPFSFRMTTEQVYYILQRQADWGTNMNETIKYLIDQAIDKNPIVADASTLKQPEPEPEQPTSLDTPEGTAYDPSLEPEPEPDPEEEEEEEKDDIELRF